jgi:hypothetical protein
MDKNKVIWHTIKLKIPSEMISIGKNGVMTVKQSLTKKNNIAKRLKEPSVILESDPNITEAQIIDKGDVENVDDVKVRQTKLKTIRKKLETLPNKPVITKTDFIEKSKEKVAPRVAQRKEYTKNVLNNNDINKKIMGMSSKQALRQDNINNWANKYLKELINNFDKLDENGKYFLFKNLKEYEQLSKDPKKVVIEFGTNVVLPNIEITEKVKTFIKSKPKRPLNYSVSEMKDKYHYATLKS